MVMSAVFALMPWWQSWSESVWRASWQGALCALGVWLIARAVPSLPASLRALLWWGVALKFVLTLGWPRPMPLALLPAGPVAQAQTAVEPPAQSQTPARTGLGGEALPAGPARSVTAEAPSSMSLGARDVAPSMSLVERDVAPSMSLAARDVASSMSLEARDVAPSMLPAARDVVPSMSLAARDVASSAPLEARDVASSKSLAARDVAPSMSLAVRDVSPSAPLDARDVAPSMSLAARDVSPSALLGARAVEGATPAHPSLLARSLASTSDAVAAARAHPWAAGIAWALLALWVAGVVLQVRGHVRAWRQVRGMRERARPFRHPVLEEEAEFLASEAGLRRPPVLLVSDEVVSPLAAGLVSPVIVLPSKAVRELPESALRMALAHEVAHLRRGDLWLGWVPALAETVLFFHPLARRAAREYALAREEACDAEALRLTGAEPADYGELLIAFGITRPPGSAAALGASAHLHALHRRLRMLEHVDVVPTPSRRWLKGALFTLGAVVLLPFQVVAKAAPAADTAKAAAPAPLKVGTVRQLPQDAVASKSAPAAEEPLKLNAQTPPGTPPPPAPPAPVPGRVSTTHHVVAPPGAPPPLAPLPPLPPPTPGAPRTFMHVSAAPTPPRPPAPPSPPVIEDGDTFAYLSDGRTMMAGSSEDLILARTFKQKGKDLLFVRRDQKPMLIRDAKTLEQVRKLMEDAGKMGDAQAALGKQQAALGQQQAALGQKQAELAYPQAQLVSKQMAIASKRAEIGSERARLHTLADSPERDRQEAALDKRDEALDKESEGFDKQIEELGSKQAALGEEQAKLGEQQAKLGEQQAKLAEQDSAKSREQVKKVMDVIDDAIRKGLAEPLPG
jgi:beta-lactamase regulating signal transducer with metallopeptidase domain